MISNYKQFTGFPSQVRLCFASGRQSEDQDFECPRFQFIHTPIPLYTHVLILRVVAKVKVKILRVSSVPIHPQHKPLISKANSTYRFIKGNNLLHWLGEAVQDKACSIAVSLHHPPEDTEKDACSNEWPLSQSRSNGVTHSLIKVGGVREDAAYREVLEVHLLGQGLSYGFLASARGTCGGERIRWLSFRKNILIFWLPSLLTNQIIVKHFFTYVYQCNT